MIDDFRLTIDDGKSASGIGSGFAACMPEGVRQSSINKGF
jgi:hypothetical protein